VRPVGPVLVLVLVLASSACQRRDLLAEARALQENGDLYGSLEPLRALIAERPNDAEVAFLYGSALSQLGHVTQGEFSLEKAMDDPKWRVPAGLQLGVGALRTANYPQAVTMATRVLEAEPDHVGALLIRAEARARARKDLELAIADVDRALEIEPDRLDAQRPRILALLALDRIPDAEKAIEELGKQLEGSDPSDGLAGWHCATRAVFTEEKATYEDDQKAGKRAEELWKDCLQRFPGVADVVQNAVEYYDDRGEADRSTDVLRAAVAAGGPDTDGFRSLLVPRLRAAGKPEEAEKLLREAADGEDPYRGVIAGFELAEHYQALSDYAKSLDAAERAMKRARELGTPEPQVLFEYADALLLANELDRAEAVAKEMTVGAHRELVLARVAQERGDYRRANRHYDEAFRLWPDNGDARFTAAVAAETNGDFTRAIEQYRYAIRIHYGDTEARTRLARLYLAEGKPALALEMLEGPQLPPDSEADRLALRLRVQQGELSGKGLHNALAQRAKAKPGELARAFASVAEGMTARGDAAGALRLLREQERVSLRDPEAAPALRAYVAIAKQAGQGASALTLARALVAEHPDAAVAHELLGRALEASGAPREPVQAAYARAVELDAKDAGALLGLARLELERDPAGALALYDRAAAADSEDPEAVLGGARALVKSRKPADAEARLAAALPRHPLAAALAVELCELRAARNEYSDETLALARRAVRIGGSPETWELLARVHTGRGDTDKAAEATARAQKLRDQGPDSRA
jgi:tetratricopeptide (TPR) repeat protein